MNEKKYYICERCGNLADLICDGKAPIRCCGQNMTLLEPGTVDASHEKHIPSVEVKQDKVIVTVGEVPHPMSVEHHIAWITLLTDQGEQRKVLSPDGAPQAVFVTADEKPLAVYAYCNLHGLWKKEL